MKKYIVINKSDTNLTLMIKGNPVQLNFGARYTVDETDITPQVRDMAKKGMVALIFDEGRPAGAISTKDNKKPVDKKETTKESE